jgi:hypothetical protein
MKFKKHSIITQVSNAIIVPDNAATMERTLTKRYPARSAVKLFSDQQKKSKKKRTFARNHVRALIVTKARLKRSNYVCVAANC